MPRSFLAYALAFFLLPIGLVLAGCDSGGSGMEEPDEPEASLSGVVSSSEDLSTLADVLQAADLAETLGDEDATFTVFAPVNAAFENVDVEILTNNPEQLRDLLTYHLVRGESLTASDLKNRESVTTVEGQKLEIRFEDGTLTVGGIPVEKTNVQASNGVAHTIGGVLVPESFPRRTSYDLAAQSNSGAVPSGAGGTVTLWEYSDNRTLVTLSLDDGPTGTSVSHPVHIHKGSVSDEGEIEIYLSPLDGTNVNDANEGTSARLVNRSFDDLAGFDGYVNIHESVAEPQNVISQGNIGANAEGTLGTGLQIAENPQSVRYELFANSNDGAFPDGIPGQVQLLELTPEMTLATVRLDPDEDGEFEDGSTQGSLQEATVSHPAHIHAGAAGSGGSIQFYLSPVDGSDGRARSSQIIERSFGDLTGTTSDGEGLDGDGYVNVHESARNLKNVISQGNVGPNAGDEPENPFVYPTDGYGAETVANLLSFDLGVRVGNASDYSESVLLDLYTGNIDNKAIRAAQYLTAEQSVYGDIASGVDLSSLVSAEDLQRSSQLESPDTPNPGSPVNADELLRYYFEEAGADDITVTPNGTVLSQFVEKMLLGTPIYGQGAAILSDFANGTVSSNRAEKWDAAFGSLGFPRTLEPFLDYSGGAEGLASGPARDIDGNGAVDLTSEYVHAWASYAIERAALAENNGNPNDFARRAFGALVEGREDIENDEDPADHAETVLEAWEATVAVNVIHYINSMEGSLSNLADSKTVEEGDVDEDAWSEAKAFAWNLQSYSSEVSTSQLSDILEKIGNDPPYGEMTVAEYESDLEEATQILAVAYGFNDSNVENW